jgi:hypothetical protein
LRHSHRARIFEHLYEPIVALYNKCEDSTEFKNLLDLVGSPSSQFDVGHHRFYNFYKFGFILQYEKSLNIFSSITFEYDTAGTRAREVERYKGALPAAIMWSDSCAEVERKLGTKPERAGWVSGCDSSSCDPRSQASDYWQHYECPPFRYTLIFESEEQGLSLLAMRLLLPERAIE